MIILIYVYFLIILCIKVIKAVVVPHLKLATPKQQMQQSVKTKNTKYTYYWNRDRN
jgi:uncharacterized metal-binding protein